MTRRSSMPAVAVALVAFALYLSTLAPGLIPLEDTPKFQFIGRVLGTAHNPSYPLYVLVSYLFGWLPLNNLAWRINLMSAVFGAAAVGMLQLAILEVTGSQLLGVAAALGLATGLSFWATATFAEVYTLHIFLVAGMTWSLLAWRWRHDSFWFFLAISFFSLGLGHHTSIVVMGPAVAAFALIVAPRFALAVRTQLKVLALFAGGLAQYLFVILRTYQGAYLESRATNLGELWGVIRGQAWVSLLRPASAETVATTGPWVLRLVADEVSLAVALVAVAGLGVLLFRDRALLALACGATLGVVAFAVFFPGQTQYFLLPAYFFVWLLAAVAVDAVSRIGGPRPSRSVVAAISLAAVAIWHGWANFTTNDLSHRRSAMRYFDAVARQLPAGAGIVGEDWLTDRMVLYQKFSDPTFGERQLIASADPASWRAAEPRRGELFAFEGMSRELRFQGFQFELRAWPMAYGSLRQFLDDQRHGSVVALAIPAARFAAALEHDAVPLDLIGHTVPEPSSSNLVVVGALGRRGALREDRPAEQAASVMANRGIPIGSTGIASPNHILVEASFDRASIRVNNREVVGSAWPVVALWDERGLFQGAWAVAADGLMPMPEGAISLHRLRRVVGGTRLGPAPVDLTAQSADGQMLIAPFAGAPAIVYVARRGSLAPRLFDSLADVPPLVVREFHPGSDELATALHADGWPSLPTPEPMTSVYRLELSPAAWPRHVSFGGIPGLVTARWAGTGDGPVSFGVDLARQLEPVDDRSERLRITRDYFQMFLANGWSAVENDDTETGGFTRTTGSEAEVLVPCDIDSCASLTLQMRPVEEAGTVSLAVNGTQLEAQLIDGSWQRYRWALPSATRRRGTNAVTVRVTAPVYLSDIVATRTRPAASAP